MKIVIIGSVNPRGYAGDPIFLWIFSFFGKLFVWIISFFLPLGGADIKEIKHKGDSQIASPLAFGLGKNQPGSTFPCFHVSTLQSNRSGTSSATKRNFIANEILALASDAKRRATAIYQILPY